VRKSEARAVSETLRQRGLTRKMEGILSGSFLSSVCGGQKGEEGATSDARFHSARVYSAGVGGFFACCLGGVGGWGGGVTTL